MVFWTRCIDPAPSSLYTSNERERTNKTKLGKRKWKKIFINQLNSASIKRDISSKKMSWMRDGGVGGKNTRLFVHLLHYRSWNKCESYQVVETKREPTPELSIGRYKIQEKWVIKKKSKPLHYIFRAVLLHTLFANTHYPNTLTTWLKVMLQCVKNILCALVFSHIRKL